MSLDAFMLEIVNTYGYLGVFLVSLISNASVILPIPAQIIIFLASPLMNPLLLGIIAGFGASLGELSGYVLGVGGRAVISQKYEKQLEKIKKWINKYNTFSVIIVFATTPLPFDVIGIFCGVSRYSWKRFLLATTIGKIIMFLLIAFGGYYSLTWILRFYGVM